MNQIGRMRNGLKRVWLHRAPPGQKAAGDA